MPPRKYASITIPEHLYKKLKKAAKKSGKPISRLAQEILESELESMKRKLVQRKEGGEGGVYPV